ncbi:MAG: protein kinase domain-containing protein, partial [Burkholderiales bacterium]
MYTRTPLPGGAMLGPYRILRLIGAGGMGEVYAAEDPRLRRTIALKLLPDRDDSDPERVSRLVREAQAAAALQHPGIVTIHSVEEADNRRFITMELIDGDPLSALIQPGGLEIDEALRVGAAIAAAIAAAHSRGVIHRDLKPANVMIAKGGAIKVVDFGLARLQHAIGDDESTLARTSTYGSLVGTVAYMSPEQAEGRPLDQRTDIFSLGVVLYEMLTGQRPFAGDTPLAVLSAILKDAVRPMSDITPQVSDNLTAIVDRCLQKDPALRYQSAMDVARALERVRKPPAAALTNVRPPTDAHRRGPRALAAASLVIGLVAAAVAAWFVVSWRRDSGITTQHMARLTADGRAAVAGLSPDGRHIVHVKQTGGLTSLWVRQTGTQSDLQIVPPADVRYAGATFSADGDDVY